MKLSKERPIIIEFRHNGTLEKESIEYENINVERDVVYVKTLDINTGNIKEYTDIETFSINYYNNREKTFIVYNNTDIQFLQYIEFKGILDVCDCTDEHNIYLEMQNHAYKVKNIDASNFGIILEENNQDKICNIARLVLTSPFPFKSFVSKQSNCIMIPNWNRYKSCYAWEIKDNDKIFEIVKATNKYRNMMENLKLHGINNRITS